MRQREALRSQLGLDQPLWIQWWKWVTGFVTGDMGNLYTSTGTRPVWNGSVLPSRCRWRC